MAVTQEEEPRLLKLHERGVANGVKDLTLLNSEELKKIEPHCRVSCRFGLHAFPSFKFCVYQVNYLVH